MEFRGKAPAIVCEDVDLAKAARGCGMWVVSMAPFVNSGQIYIRIIVNSKVAEEFFKALLLTLRTFPTPKAGTKLSWSAIWLLSIIRSLSLMPCPRALNS